MLTKRKEKKARLELHKNFTSYIEQNLLATANKEAAVCPPTTHL